MIILHFQTFRTIKIAFCMHLSLRTTALKIARFHFFSEQFRNKFKCDKYNLNLMFKVVKIYFMFTYIEKLYKRIIDTLIFFINKKN